VNNIPEIETLIKNEREAHKALSLECERRWPKGTRVGVIIRYGQTKPTIATIAGFDGYTAFVVLEAPKRRHGRVVGEWLHSRKRVPYTAIVWGEEGGAK
jgi:hypothetical protein